MAGYFDVQIIILFNNGGCVVLAKLFAKESAVNNFCGTVASRIGKSWLSLLAGIEISKLMAFLSKGKCYYLHYI